VRLQPLRTFCSSLFQNRSVYWGHSKGRETKPAGAEPNYTKEINSEACAAGVQAEIDNAALYDELFSMVDNTDIIRVFTSLQQASETKHLPAFERCAP
jgi:hypothetical protein